MRSPATYLAKLKRLGYHPRVASRLMRITKTLAAPDGTVLPTRLDRLPADPMKLVAHCARPPPDMEQVVTEHDCRQLDRQEVTELVRERQGQKPSADKKQRTPTQVIEEGWAQFVEALLNNIKARRNARI